MKNFKLLLASTAIISMGTMTANAEPEPFPVTPVTMNVSADLELADTFFITNHIVFGTRIATAADFAGLPAVVAIDPTTGARTPDDGRTLGEFHRGEVELTMASANPYTLDLSDVTMVNDEDGTTAIFMPEFAEIASETINSSYVKKTYGIGGSVIFGDDETVPTPGHYTGELTVTAVYPTEPTEP